MRVSLWWDRENHMSLCPESLAAMTLNTRRAANNGLEMSKACCMRADEMRNSLLTSKDFPVEYILQPCLSAVRSQVHYQIDLKCLSELIAHHFTLKSASLRVNSL